MALLKAKMQHDQISWYQQILIWLSDNWKEIGGFGLASQFIDRFFKWLTKRSEARIKELMQGEIKATVTPEIDNLAKAVDSLRESIYILNDKIIKIK